MLKIIKVILAIANLHGREDIFAFGAGCGDGQMAQAECRCVALLSDHAVEEPSPILHLLRQDQRAIPSLRVGEV